MIQFKNEGLESTNIDIGDILHYLRMEEGETIPKDKLTFIGKAEVKNMEYWLWSYSDPKMKNCFAIFEKAKDEGYGCISTRPNSNNLQPEEWLKEYAA